MDPKLMVRAMGCVVGALVAVTIGDPTFLANASVPMASFLAEVAKNGFRGKEESLAKGIFGDGHDPSDWLKDDTIAKVVARALAGRISKFAGTVNDNPLKSKLNVLAKAMEDSWPRWKFDIVHEDDKLDAARIASLHAAHVQSVGISAEDWLSILKEFCPVQQRGAWDGIGVPILADSELQPLAKAIEASFFEDVRTTLLSDDNQGAYRNVLIHLVGGGFERVLTILEDESEDIKAALALLRRANRPHLREHLPTGAGSPLAFQTQRVDFRGREIELESLRRFFEDPRGFLWWRLTGPAGSGKSRLALEVISDARLLGWEAGWINTRAPGALDPWERWEPERPALIVMDYALDNDDLAARLINILGDRSRNVANGLSVPIRLLLLARESTAVRWPRLFAIGGRDAMRADLFELPSDSDSESGVTKPSSIEDRRGSQLRLGSLADNAMAGIVYQAWCKTPAAADYDEGAASRLIGRLKAEPGLWSPLFAQIGAEAYALGKENPMGDITKENLISYVLQREEDRWVDVPLQYANLAMLACIWEWLVWPDQKPSIDPPNGYNESVFPETLSSTLAQKALSLGAGYDPAEGVVRKFEPDLLGELFVVRRIRGDYKGGDREACRYAEAIWDAVRPKQEDGNGEFDYRHRWVRSFLYRLHNSFPDLVEEVAAIGCSLDESLLLEFASDELTDKDLAYADLQAVLQKGAELTRSARRQSAVEAWAYALESATSLAAVRDRKEDSQLIRQELLRVSTAHPQSEGVNAALARMFRFEIYRSKLWRASSTVNPLQELRSLVEERPLSPSLASLLAVELSSDIDSAKVEEVETIKEEISRIAQNHRQDGSIRDALLTAVFRCLKISCFLHRAEDVDRLLGEARSISSEMVADAASRELLAHSLASLHGELARNHRTTAESNVILNALRCFAGDFPEEPELRRHLAWALRHASSIDKVPGASPALASALDELRQLSAQHPNETPIQLALVSALEDSFGISLMDGVGPASRPLANELLSLASELRLISPVPTELDHALHRAMRVSFFANGQDLAKDFLGELRLLAETHPADGEFVDEFVAALSQLQFELLVGGWHAGNGLLFGELRSFAHKQPGSPLHRHYFAQALSLTHDSQSFSIEHSSRLWSELRSFARTYTEEEDVVQELAEAVRERSSSGIAWKVRFAAEVLSRFRSLATEDPEDPQLRADLATALRCVSLEAIQAGDDERATSILEELRVLVRDHPREYALYPDFAVALGDAHLDALHQRRSALADSLLEELRKLHEGSKESSIVRDEFIFQLQAAIDQADGQENISRLSGILEFVMSEAED